MTQTLLNPAETSVAIQRQFLVLHGDGLMELLSIEQLNERINTLRASGEDDPALFTSVEGNLVRLTFDTPEPSDPESHPVRASITLCTPSGVRVGTIDLIEH